MAQSWSVQLRTSAGAVGTAKTSSAGLSGTLATVTLGGTGQLWGARIPTATVKGSAFGIHVAGTETGGSTIEFAVDSATVKVHHGMTNPLSLTHGVLAGG